MCDEVRDALHHPLTRAFAANVNVTVVRTANKTVSPVLQLAVEFVEHEVTEQWRKRTSLRSSFHARADQSILYPVHVMTRKSFGLMMRKLSVTESR